MSSLTYKPRYSVLPEDVLSELNTRMLVDGFDYVLDLAGSNAANLIDARTGNRYLDFFTCFASTPVGMNHPAMIKPDFLDYLGRIAVNKPSNSDIYSEAMATFVKTFFTVAVPSEFKYGFFVEGGALAIENALKVAFDWKVRKNFAKGYIAERGHQILHFARAFHGRTGYTMSLTNTDPTKTNLYPKFKWPRVHNPSIKFPLDENNLAQVIAEEQLSIAQIKQAFIDNRDDIAAIIIEPIQGEGGDNHFRPEFFAELRKLADENEALLIFDEVQTGVGLTGSMWVHQQFGTTPDIMAFGKKMQVCGIVVTDRIDDIPNNVFHTSSRINSTWGGNLVDMVRATKYLEIIEEEQLLSHVQRAGHLLQSHFSKLTAEFPTIISNARGRGLFAAFDLPNADYRKAFLSKCFEKGLIILGCGERSVRFRPALNLTDENLHEGMGIIHSALEGM
ncbi:MAG: L-lysine 6-transaminase [Ignavibacteriae bacterium]|nr:L-lysine 6-transaminase [Ignavibacteriota bacterium]